MRSSILIFVAAAVIGLAGCARLLPAPSDVYVMRHLHTPASAHDPDLTAEGQRQAALLVTWFRRRPPAIIYLSSAKRARQTVAPLASALHITPIVYDPADTPALVAAVSRETRTLLIAGRSNTVPDIIQRLGGQPPAPLVHEHFGDIWMIDGRTRATVRAKID